MSLFPGGVVDTSRRPDSGVSFIQLLLFSNFFFFLGASPAALAHFSRGEGIASV